MSVLLQPAPSAPLQEGSVTQDPLGATQMSDPSTAERARRREDSTELPLLEQLR